MAKIEKSVKIQNIYFYWHFKITSYFELLLTFHLD